MIAKKEGVCFKYTLDSSHQEPAIVKSKEISVQTDDPERLCMYAVLICFVSILFDVFLGVAAFVCASVTDSSAGYAFALDCMLDMIAASLVLWRFYGSSATFSDSREKVTCLSLGILFCLASIGILSKSVYDLAERSIPQQLMYMFVLAGLGSFINPILAVMKYMLGKKMDSQSLVLEAMNTSLSAVLAMMLAGSDALFFYVPSAWTIDPITSIIVALILFISGIRVLRQRKDSNERTPLLSRARV